MARLTRTDKARLLLESGIPDLFLSTFVSVDMPDENTDPSSTMLDSGSRCHRECCRGFEVS